MQARALFRLIKGVGWAKDRERQLIESYLALLKLGPEDDQLVYFESFKSYLDKNVLCIKLGKLGKLGIKKTAEGDVGLFKQLMSDTEIKIILNRENKHVQTIGAYFNGGSEAFFDRDSKVYFNRGSNENDYTPLLHSLIQFLIKCSFGHYREFVIGRIEELISEGVDINIRNRFSQTPLMYAAYEGDLFSLQKLLDLNADINYDNGEYTAVDLAVCANQVNALRMLLFNGAKPKQVGFYEYHYKKPSESVLQLINESEKFKWLRTKDLIDEAMTEALLRSRPIEIIASYEARPSLCGYFKVIKKNAEEECIRQEFKKTCIIM